MGDSGKASLLEFPCEFPIKMMGRDSDEFRRVAIELVEKHAGKSTSDAIRMRPSRKGNFLSITITIKAINLEQLDNIYRDLSSNDEIVIAL